MSTHNCSNDDFEKLTTQHNGDVRHRSNFELTLDARKDHDDDYHHQTDNDGDHAGDDSDDL